MQTDGKGISGTEQVRAQCTKSGFGIWFLKKGYPSGQGTP